MLPLRTDLQLLRWQPGACALAAPSCGRVHSSFGLIGEGPEWWWDFLRFKVPIVMKPSIAHYPKQHLLVKNIKKGKPRRRRCTCTRQKKSFKFRIWKHYWTGCCWPVCDEFRLIWECEACWLETGSTDLNSPVTRTRQSTRSRQLQS